MIEHDTNERDQSKLSNLSKRSHEIWLLRKFQIVEILEIVVETEIMPMINSFPMIQVRFKQELPPIEIVKQPKQAQEH
jgi:hypothetical protein